MIKIGKLAPAIKTVVSRMSSNYSVFLQALPVDFRFEYGVVSTAGELSNSSCTRKIDLHRFFPFNREARD